jgi:hypothetical protein
MPSLLKRNILVALICALPAFLGVESATGNSAGGSSSAGGGSSSAGGGSSSAGGSSSGHSGGNGGGNSWSAPSGGHSSTGLNTAHMSGASRGGHFASDPVTHPTATGDSPSGRFIHRGAIPTCPVQSAKQRQFATGYVPSNLEWNDELWRKRHHGYHRFHSP